MKKIIFIIFIFMFTGFSAFAQTESDFQIEKITGNRARIIGYSGNEVNIRIPQVIQGMMVTEIGDGAFLGKGLIRVTLPHNLLVIGKEAFKNNKIERIKIGAKVDVSPDAFDNRFAAVYLFMEQKAGTYLFNNKAWRRR